MQERAFGWTGRTVSELGVGMWGMGGGIGGWTGADDRQSLAVLQAAAWSAGSVSRVTTWRCRSRHSNVVMLS